MLQQKKAAENRHDQHKFSNAMPAFDKAMKKIVATPKTEVDRLEQAEKSRNASSK